MDHEVARAAWDAHADTFDDAVDHGLASEAARAAWWSALVGALPEPGSAVADLGCGTGSLTLLLAQHGYRVAALDFSPRMIERARAKTAAVAESVSLDVGDAAEPPWPHATFDAVLARHVVWALPDPAVALGRWADLLAPGGRLVLVEGRWDTGAGLRAAELVALLPESLGDVQVEPLPDPALWGGPIDDERYLLTARA